MEDVLVDREVMEFDVVIVGAGPAGLATAYHLQSLCEAHNAKGEGGSLEPEIVVLEKGKEVGAHIFSGAVMDPKGIAEIMPDWKEQGAPIEAEVSGDEVWNFKEGGGKKLPFTPPSLRNHGCYVVSLNKLIRWFGEKVEEKGVAIFPGFPGREIVYEGNKVKGVQLADAGLDKEGKPKANYEPGGIVQGKVTVFAEGSRGSLTKGLIQKLSLDGRNPQNYETGVKEVWEVPKDRFESGFVLHAMGWPHPKTVTGGGWVYGMGDGPGGGRLVSVGFVTSLDYKDPSTDPHRYFQLFKTHPKVRAVLEGGEMLDYGAKSLPAGGFFSMPKLYGDGFLLVGDNGGFMNNMRLKGIHLAFHSGRLAAETIFEALKKEQASGNPSEILSAENLSGFQERFDKGWAKTELYATRNFHQGFEKGRTAGMINAAFVTLFGGKGTLWRDGLPSKPDYATKEKLNGRKLPEPPKLPELGTLTFDKVTDVFRSGTIHEEDQPCHLQILEPDVCASKCTQEYGNPCRFFCPAQVYEWVEEEGKGRLQLNPSNCVHCKTCDIVDPYQIINWVTPEGGGGPGYHLL
ncbi:MAG TPA: electron transfer flavoprotein-ubiquinone oxidoreductase [Planctomycetes bacterium]|nr:electron transfer flavoprotein-ubiquinone oxidoreductase [Planctomycetota bacterium]